MKKACGFLLAGWLAIGLVGGVSAAELFTTIARNAILLDMTHDRILFAKNAEERVTTASLSKIMTLYLVFDDLKRDRVRLDDRFLVSVKAWRMRGSRMFVEVDTLVRVEDLIRGIAVQSGNDASVVLAEGLSGSEEAFVERMNQTARALGMNDTRFANSSGWPDPNHYSTAFDLAILSQATIRDFPEYYFYYAQTEFTHNSITQSNRNLLLKKRVGVDGLKTGYTQRSGYSLAASSVRDQRRLIAIVTGLPSAQARANEALRLFQWGFEQFRTYPLFEAEEIVDRSVVIEGVTPTVPLKVMEDLEVLLSREQRDRMTVTLRMERALTAPVEREETVGEIVVLIEDEVMRTVPVVTAQEVSRKGFFRRVFEDIRYFFFGWL